jgi:hypothetical protein
MGDILLIDGQLLTKNGIAVLRLAREFILLKEGQRIETVADYANKLGLGRGTIQTALRYLENIEAIHLEVRGHLGTSAVKVDYKKLWTVSGLGSITGVMPLPYSRRYEGLATGFYKAFEKASIQFNMAYMRGGYKREEALLQGKYDFAVMSKPAACYLMESCSDVEIVLDLGKHSFVKGHRILFADPQEVEIRDGMKVAIDSSSIDISILTRYECDGKDVEYVELTYNQILKSLQDGKIDAAIWSIDEVDDRNLNISFGDLKSTKVKDMDEDDTKAVLLVKKSNWGIDSIIRHMIDKEYIVDIQNKVIKGEILPSY